MSDLQTGEVLKRYFGHESLKPGQSEVIERVMNLSNTLAVLPKENGIPFYVAGPTTTPDLSLDNGDQIEIEQRSQTEVTEFRGVRVAPEGVEALNPGFEVTPARYVSAIITEAGVARPPYNESLGLAVKSAN